MPALTFTEASALAGRNTGLRAVPAFQTVA
jgi:hypothetical protein